MSEKLGTDSSNLLNRLSHLSAECQWTPSQQIWIYDMRQSDTLPKSQSDTQRLYVFVELLLKSWFDDQEKNYLFQHIHIATCFFVWYFTKPNFFYKDNVTKQTTRNGIQRVWTPLLLGKKVKSQKAPIHPTTPKRQISTTNDTLLTKQQQQKTKCQNDIQTLLDISLDWEDPKRLHLKISEYIMNTNSGLSMKQNKKLQKIYNEYITITTKINKTMDKINKVQHANAKIASTHKEPVWAKELGPPPNSPSKLIRQSACELNEEELELQMKCLELRMKCPACISGQPNQLAHIGGCIPFDEMYEGEEEAEGGGCLPDELDVVDEEGEEDVPESWEDL